MNKIVLILGGARSGKSAYALQLAKKHKKVVFVATCQGLDKEMRERIRAHRQARPRHWETLEEPRDLAGVLGKIGSGFDCIVVDCLTLLVSNLILAGRKERSILKEIEDAFAQLRKKKATAILVSNEVGLGLVPANRLGRDFRDIAGKVNQLAAKEADRVCVTVSGIPVEIKPGARWKE
ncbi:MAG TPA: bifunctional adenosylcobinamide kinase/adenosylcobinamide-phosphate guanylyltransferase [Patescibacteria group bacterium]|nr:bifunctional adenosylcobinamide kinase/adenosylcobinamide-phosphate guanylyltransferase [Patescibacteria group bacterium]